MKKSEKAPEGPLMKQPYSKSFPGKSCFILAAILVMLIGTDGAVEAQNNGQPQPLKLNEFTTIAVPDRKLRIANLQMSRRYNKRGTGEFLDASFDIINHTNDPIELYGYVLACHYRDAVDHSYRRLLPYPPWRKRDFDKETFLIQYLTITPQNIADSLIWNTNDPDYRFYHRSVSKLRSSPGEIPVADVHPPLWKYLQYMQRYPTQGLKFTLFGSKGPAAQESLQTNWIPPTVEERRKKTYTNYEKHTYSLYHRARQTIFHSHHHIEFTGGYRFFNLVAVQLFDARIAEEYEAAEGKTPPGEEELEPLLYRHIVLLKNWPGNR